MTSISAFVFASADVALSNHSGLEYEKNVTALTKIVAPTTLANELRRVTHMKSYLFLC